jgi:hypothetical protein
MARSIQNMKKTTLYLDWDAVQRIRAALERLPGNMSLSSILSEQLGQVAIMLEGMASIITDMVDDAHTKAVEVRRQAKEVKRAGSVPPKSGAVPVPAGTPKRQKKSA